MLRVKRSANGNSEEDAVVLISKDYNAFNLCRDLTHCHGFPSDLLQTLKGIDRARVIVVTKEGHTRSGRFCDGGAKMRPRTTNRQILRFIHTIAIELRKNFGINAREALWLIQKAGVLKSLHENPLGLHDSAHQWALIVLTKTNNYEILEKYYSMN